MAGARFRRALRRALIGWTAIAVTACGPGADTPGGPESGTISLQLDATSGTVQLGGGQIAGTATIVRSGGFDGPVGMSITGGPPSITGTAIHARTVGAVTTLTISIIADGNALPGLYPLLVRASGNGVAPVDLTYGLTVVPPAPSYNIRSSTSIPVMTQGGNTQITITVAHLWFNGSVTLSAVGLPPGVTASFLPTESTGNPVLQAVTVANSIMTLTAGAAVPPGDYPISVQGLSPVVATRAVELTLRVVGPSPLNP